jgi:hypothetical protein
MTLIVGVYADFTGHGEAAAWMITLCISRVIFAIGKLAWRGLTQAQVR